MRTRREFRINLVFRLCILQSLENGEKAVFKPAVPSIAEGRFSWPRFGLHRQRPTASFRGFCGYLPAISIRCDPFEKVRRADRQKRGKVSGYSRLHCCRISSPASFSGNKRCGRCCSKPSWKWCCRTHCSWYWMRCSAPCWWPCCLPCSEPFCSPLFFQEYILNHLKKIRFFSSGRAVPVVGCAVWTTTNFHGSRRHYTAGFRKNGCEVVRL